MCWIQLMYSILLINQPYTPEIYTLSSRRSSDLPRRRPRFTRAETPPAFQLTERDVDIVRYVARNRFLRSTRSEEHTSELQSHSDLVCRLLLEKKKCK